jgi:hypothetical protein
LLFGVAFGGVAIGGERKGGAAVYVGDGKQMWRGKDRRQRGSDRGYLDAR